MYMINGNELPLVLEHHDLVLRVASVWIFPVINGDFGSLGAVVARHVKDATSRNALSVARSLLSDAAGVVDVRI
jgi:hypothetical protein